MTRNTSIMLAVLVALGGVYWYFFMGSTPVTPLTTSAPADVGEQQFIDLSSKLSSISFDTSIFADPRFTSLTSLATPITPEAQGRKDPFAPLGR